MLGTQELLHGEDSLPVLVSQASHLLGEVIWVGRDPRGLAMFKLSLQVSPFLELNRWRGLADSRPAHPSGRQGEPLCIFRTSAMISLALRVKQSWVFEVASLQGRFQIEPRGPILHSSTNHCKAAIVSVIWRSGVLCTHGLVDAVRYGEGWYRVLSGLMADLLRSRGSVSIYTLVLFISQDTETETLRAYVKNENIT